MKPNSQGKGTASALAALCATALLLPAQTLTILHNFNMKDGYYPAGMLQATDGNYYGFTNSGGANKAGTIFKITPGGSFTTFYTFCSLSGCADGSVPTGLIQATDGNFYGTASEGGANSTGTFFRITTSGALTTLYSFCYDCPEGWNPGKGIIQAADGNFYGTTIYGGHYQHANGYGGIFKITPDGTLTNLYNFCSLASCADGAYPYAGLVEGANGDFYGTTWWGGIYQHNSGTVFKITPSGALTTLYSFDCSTSAGCADGGQPDAGLLLASNGELYGTTAIGGMPAPFKAGTVFRITPRGTLTTGSSFCNQTGCPSGSEVQAPLIQASDGNFYGTSTLNGTRNGGAVFKVTPSGALSTVYSFCYKSCASGRYPDAGVIQGTDGDFYGTTSLGGPYYAGTVFRLSASLPPFVKVQRAFAKVGQSVTILGTDLTGTTSVAFNGVPAPFAVNSSGSAITATVPAGATTGDVQVVTSRARLSTTQPFWIQE